MKNILTNGVSLEEPSHQQRLKHQLPNLKKNFQEIKSILENEKIVMHPYSVDSKLLPEKIQMIRFAYSKVIKFNYLISPCSEALEVEGEIFAITDYKKSYA